MAKTTGTAKTAADATKAFDGATTKAQEQMFALLEQSQAATLEGYQAIIDLVGSVEVPTVPGLDAWTGILEPFKVPADAHVALFDFTQKVIDNQREFAGKIAAVTAQA